MLFMASKLGPAEDTSENWCWTELLSRAAAPGLSGRYCLIICVLGHEAGRLIATCGFCALPPREVRQ